MEENDETEDIDVCELTKNLHINLCAAGKIPLTKGLTGVIILLSSSTQESAGVIQEEVLINGKVKRNL